MASVIICHAQRNPDCSKIVFLASISVFMSSGVTDFPIFLYSQISLNPVARTVSRATSYVADRLA